MFDTNWTSCSRVQRLRFKPLTAPVLRARRELVRLIFEFRHDHEAVIAQALSSRQHGFRQVTSCMYEFLAPTFLL